MNLDSSDTHIHDVEAKRCRVDNDVGERSNFKKIPTHTQDHGDA